MPHLESLSKQIRDTGNRMYPQVCSLLGESHTAPRQFDIKVKKRLVSKNVAETRLSEVYLDGEWLERMKDDPSAVDQLLVHEMTHVAQCYFRPIIGRWLVLNPHPPSYWQEGIADYVCFKLGETNGWHCPECSFTYPHYLDGYACAGAFLLYVEETHGPDIVRRLNATLRKGTYSDDFFFYNTGKSLETLWAEFRQTAAFTPGAARMQALQDALGFKHGKPPKDLERRIKAFVEQQVGVDTRKLIDQASISGARGKVQSRLALICYFTQPGGTAEAFMTSLMDNHQMPGFAKDEHGTLAGVLRSRDVNAVFPATRSFVASKKGDSCTYHYTVVRESEAAPWKLQRAWRTVPNGTLAEEYGSLPTESAHGN